MATKNSRNVLAKLRNLMKNSNFVTEKLHAYIIPSGDAHMSEYVAACDKRREFITGFTGSAGTAIVTETGAALWTDGRYFLQAERQLGEDWTLYKQGLPSTPSLSDWLNSVLPTGGRVGADPMLLSHETWHSIGSKLKSGGHMVVPVSQNLVDVIWEERPRPPCNPIMTLSTKYTGLTWQEKMCLVRSKMKEKGAGALIVTALDEIAWLFNLRGSDISYNPVFFSYALVTVDFIGLFVDESKVDSAILHHLGISNQDDDGSPASPNKVSVYPYDSIKDYLSDLLQKVQGKVWISTKSNEALVSLVPQSVRLGEQSPIQRMKAIKNDTEIEGMRKAHVKDAVTLCEFFSWLEKQVHIGDVTEISASRKLEKIKRFQEDYVSLSFESISSSGPNAAVIHYSPTEETARPITMDEIYLLDSGAQYKDGTTDVTRTIHLGTPSKQEQEAFTRVLQGHIALATAVFPNGVKGHRIECLARMPLWEAGLDYIHGTGHGVGAFLNVHEGPCSISYKTTDDAVLEEGMVLSDEPGYYEDGQFGVRIESLVVIRKANTENDYKKTGFLTFDVITLVPIQTKMLVPSMLSQKEIDWLNGYHATCREVVGDVLRDQDKQDALDWLVRETAPLG